MGWATFGTIFHKRIWSPCGVAYLPMVLTQLAALGLESELVLKIEIK
jgi:hypothetical protein